MSDEKHKPIICLDFDGVIHTYEDGWQNGIIYGDVTVGFFDWVEEAAEEFKLVVYSSRSSDPDNLKVMHDWLVQKWVRHHLNKGTERGYFPLEFTAEKPPAFITIDDRCIQFHGYWSAGNLTIEHLRQFKPWNAK